VTVICGPSQRDPESPTHVVNPKVVVEVLSDGTAEYDRTEQLQHYQQIESLAAVALVDHQSPHIDLWTRSGAKWSCARFGPGQVVPLEAVGRLVDDRRVRKRNGLQVRRGVRSDTVAIAAQRTMR
jgi:hypothetical protein